MKELKLTYRWAMCTVSFLIIFWIVLVVSVFSIIIPTTEYKVLAYLLAGLVCLLGTVVILWIWRGVLKALKEAINKEKPKKEGEENGKEEKVV